MIHFVIHFDDFKVVEEEVHRQDWELVTVAPEFFG